MVESCEPGPAILIVIVAAPCAAARPVASAKTIAHASAKPRRPPHRVLAGLAPGLYSPKMDIRTSCNIPQTQDLSSPS